jgi:hypothetical protein
MSGDCGERRDSLGDVRRGEARAGEAILPARNGDLGDATTAVILATDTGVETRNPPSSSSSSLLSSTSSTAITSPSSPSSTS